MATFPGQGGLESTARELPPRQACFTEPETMIERHDSTDRGTRHDWRLDEVMALFDRPLNDFLYEARSGHRQTAPRDSDRALRP